MNYDVKMMNTELEWKIVTRRTIVEANSRLESVKRELVAWLV